MMVCIIQSTVYKVSYSKVQYVGWDLAIVNTDIIPYKCNWSMFSSPSGKIYQLAKLAARGK